MTTDFHPTELAMLRAVCAAPGDDTPRLVLADWYTEDSGDEMLAGFGRFIRRHVAACQAGDMVFRDREWAHGQLLTIVHWDGSAWSAGNAWAGRLLGKGYMTGYTRPERWDRGFPAVVTFPSVVAWRRATGDTLVTAADRLYERVPLKKTRVQGRAPQTIDFPQLPRVPGAWRWNVQTGKVLVNHSELPRDVYRMLIPREVGGAHYPTLGFARIAAELAFTDAGRAACGLRPRFKADVEGEAMASS